MMKKLYTLMLACLFVSVVQADNNVQLTKLPANVDMESCGCRYYSLDQRSDNYGSVIGFFGGEVAFGLNNQVVEGDYIGTVDNKGKGDYVLQVGDYTVEIHRLETIDAFTDEEHGLYSRTELNQLKFFINDELIYTTKVSAECAG